MHFTGEKRVVLGSIIIFSQIQILLFVCMVVEKILLFNIFFLYCARCEYKYSKWKYLNTHDNMMEVHKKRVEKRSTLPRPTDLLFVACFILKWYFLLFWWLLLLLFWLLFIFMKIFSILFSHFICLCEFYEFYSNYIFVYRKFSVCFKYFIFIQDFSCFICRFIRNILCKAMVRVAVICMDYALCKCYWIIYSNYMFRVLWNIINFTLICTTKIIF